MIRPRRSSILTGSRIAVSNANVRNYALPEIGGEGLFSASAYQAFTEWFNVDRKLATVKGGEFVYESYACRPKTRVVACHYFRERTGTVLRLLQNFPGFKPCAYWHLPAWFEPHLRKTIVFVLPTKAANGSPDK